MLRHFVRIWVSRYRDYWKGYGVINFHGRASVRRFFQFMYDFSLFSGCPL